MKPVLFATLGLTLMLLAGCLPPSQSQLAMERDLSEMKRRLAMVEEGNAKILQQGGGTSKKELDALNRQLAEQQSGLDTLRVEMQSINGRLDDLIRDSQQRGEDVNLVRDDLGMQVTAIEDRLAGMEQRLEQLGAQNRQTVVAPAATPGLVAPSAEGPEQLYKQGLDKIRNGQEFAAGRKELEEFLKKYPQHDLYANAMYWIGEALYGEKEYERAILQFQDVIQKFTAHPKAAAAMFKQALSFKALGDSRNAKTTFQKLITTYPNSPEAQKAKQEVAGL